MTKADSWMTFQAPRNAVVTTTGIEFRGNVSTKEFWELGDNLAAASTQVESICSWSIGDWILEGGKKKYSSMNGRKEIYKEAEERFGKKLRTLQQITQVTESIKLRRRLRNLSFQHHYEVLAIDAKELDIPEAKAIAEQDAMLKKAEERKWTCSKLSDEIKKRITVISKEHVLLGEYEEMSDEDWEDLLNIPSQKTFNKQDTDSIEWAQWSWNPVTGCRHDCPYCYARDLANRWYSYGFEPAIYPCRLWAPTNMEVPEAAKEDTAFKNVFTCSMADLFGRWVPAEWIQLVLDTVKENPQWNFLILTKFPQRMAEFIIPSNAWMGTTVDCQSRVAAAEKAFANVKSKVRWLSVEPMLTPLKFKSLSMFQWVVFGGASSSTITPQWIPPFDWVSDLHQQARKAKCAVYHKTNLGVSDELRLREFPWEKRVEKELPKALSYGPIK